LPVQDGVQQGDPRRQSAPILGQVDHQPTAGSAENSTAGEDLSTDRRWLAIDWQASRALKLGQQVEEQ
jgi:hypothetical protein